jgi:hypothetical protein
MLVVEEPRSGALVSSFMTIPQKWSYGGVSFGVSLMELAATDPEYRGRGLLKHMLTALGAISVRRGDLVQGMTDILFFQADSGYHMALTQRAGRGGTAGDLPPCPREVVALRAATVEDTPVLAEIEHSARSNVLLSCCRDEAQWHHEIEGRSPGSMMRDQVMIVEVPSGPIGYLVIGYGGIPSYPVPDWLPGCPCPEPVVSISRLELRPGTAWLEVVPSVLRQVTAAHRAQGYMLWLGQEHPAYDVLGEALHRRPPDIGWFLRVPDLAALLRKIAPVLDRRLMGSAAEAFTGELRLCLYRHGLVLRFARGQLVEAEPWQGANRRASDASLPDAMFLQLLFGHGEWSALAPAYPDARINSQLGRLLLPVLLRKQRSSIWPFI